MARQKGHIKYTGTLGDVRHFKIKDRMGSLQDWLADQQTHKLKQRLNLSVLVKI